MNDAEQWSDEYETWSKRDLSQKHFVYVWADGIHRVVTFLRTGRPLILVG